MSTPHRGPLIRNLIFFALFYYRLLLAIPHIYLVVFMNFYTSPVICRGYICYMLRVRCSINGIWIVVKALIIDASAPEDYRGGIRVMVLPPKPRGGGGNLTPHS